MGEGGAPGEQGHRCRAGGGGDAVWVVLVLTVTYAVSPGRAPVECLSCLWSQSSGSVSACECSRFFSLLCGSLEPAALGGFSALSESGECCVASVTHSQWCAERIAWAAGWGRGLVDTCLPRSHEGLSSDPQHLCKTLGV